MRQAASHTANPRVYGESFIVDGTRFHEHGYGCKHALVTNRFRNKNIGCLRCWSTPISVQISKGVMWHPAHISRTLNANIVAWI